MTIKQIRERHEEMDSERKSGYHFTTNHRDEKSLRQLHKDRGELLDILEAVEKKTCEWTLEEECDTEYYQSACGRSPGSQTAGQSRKTYGYYISSAGI